MRPWLKRRVAEPVLVHETEAAGGKTVRGWLEEVGADGMLLRAPVLLLDDSEVPLDGELFVPATNVRFVQLGVSK